MDKYYYFNLYKYGCIKLAGVNVEPEHVYNYVLEKYNESVGEKPHDKAYWMGAYEFLLETYVETFIKPDSEPEVYKEEIKEWLEPKFNKRYHDGYNFKE